MRNTKKHENQYLKYYSKIMLPIATSEHGVLERKEITWELKPLSPRLIGYILKEMKENGTLCTKRKSIQNKLYQSQEGKKGYAINERAIPEAFFTKGYSKKGKQIFFNMTQTELGKRIRNWKINFKNDIKSKKSFVNEFDSTFYWGNMQAMSISTSWIAKLTLMIQGGFFDGDKKKIELARGNIELLENMIGYLADNIKKRFPEGYNLSMVGLMTTFEFLDPFTGSEWDRNFMLTSSLTQ